MKTKIFDSELTQKGSVRQVVYRTGYASIFDMEARKCAMRDISREHKPKSIAHKQFIKLKKIELHRKKYGEASTYIEYRPIYKHMGYDRYAISEKEIRMNPNKFSKVYNQIEVINVRGW